MIIDPSYRRLPASRAAMRFVRSVYDLTAHFPDDEKPGLTATLKRSAASIPTQVAESHAQADQEAADQAIVAAQTTLRQCAAYLDVAERLRLTQRWRFRTARRRAMIVAAKLTRMLDQDDWQDDDEAAASQQ